MKKKRDGYHVALGKNTYIKSDSLIDDDSRISRIQVKSEIEWKGGKSINVDGEKIDLKGFSNVGWNHSDKETPIPPKPKAFQDLLDKAINPDKKTKD